jgi:hypothetical protein
MKYRRKRKSNEYQKRSHIKSAVPERRRDPGKAGDYFQKAVIELGEARVRKAIELLKASLFHDRECAESHALLGMAYICLDRNRLGINHCNEANRLGLVNSMCMLHLIAAHGRLGCRTGAIDLSAARSGRNSAPRFRGKVLYVPATGRHQLYRRRRRP